MELRIEQFTRLSAEAFAHRLERIIRREPGLTGEDRALWWEMARCYYEPERGAAMLESLPPSHAFYFARALNFLKLRVRTLGLVSDREISLTTDSCDEEWWQRNCHRYYSEDRRQMARRAFDLARARMRKERNETVI
ncbi:MAG TPA: hypothetical protein VNQ79_06745 [Blastocatellia bacterium]|nr:hypothetical protein [Blastocatellia bacterium]